MYTMDLAGKLSDDELGEECVRDGRSLKLMPGLTR